MKVEEAITNEELNAALTELFTKVEDVGSSMDSISNSVDIIDAKAETALEIARGAKAAIKGIHSVPTNGWDTLNTAIVNFSNLGIALGLCGLGGFFMWLMFRSLDEPALPTQKKEEKKIKIEG